MYNERESMNQAGQPSYRKGEFFKALPAAVLADLEPLLMPSSYPSNMVLFTETQPSSGIYVVLEGEVKLSINSSDGRRLAFHIAKAGEVLGLSSTLTGGDYEMTADTLYPAKIAHISRPIFLKFLASHIREVQILHRHPRSEPQLQPTSACEQLRDGRSFDLGTGPSASKRLCCWCGATNPAKKLRAAHVAGCR